MNPPTLTPDNNCQVALDKMRKYDLEGLPVIQSDKNNKIVGMVWMKDIQDAYQKEIERREITSSLASSITMKDDETHIQFLEGYTIAEIEPPKTFIGKSIKQLNIRTIYGVDVLSIKTQINGEAKITAIPNPDYVIKKDDTIVVAGESKNINLLKNIA